MRMATPGKGRDHVWGEIQRCDWLKITCSLEIYTVHTRFSPGKGGDHVWGEIQRCDWLKITCSLEIYTVHTRFFAWEWQGSCMGGNTAL
jgi:hypothetical protein